MIPATDSFPRQFARTRRLTLGEPRNLVVSPDGQRIVFIRSRAGDDPINCLSLLDLTTGEERMIADPVDLLMEVDPDDVPAEERIRRERMRETASGLKPGMLPRYSSSASMTSRAERKPWL